MRHHLDDQCGLVGNDLHAFDAIVAKESGESHVSHPGNSPWFSRPQPHPSSDPNQVNQVGIERPRQLETSTSEVHTPRSGSPPEANPSARPPPIATTAQEADPDSQGELPWPLVRREPQTASAINVDIVGGRSSWAFKL